MPTAKLSLYWVAHFLDGHRIDQPLDDHYSKHDETAEHNPSAFRDVLEYMKKAKLSVFSLTDGEYMYFVNMENGEFSTGQDGVIGAIFSLEDEPLVGRKLIYYRVIEQDFHNGVGSEPQITRYAMGYEGKNSRGEIEKKIIYVGP